jgi:hypothetical protein
MADAAEVVESNVGDLAWTMKDLFAGAAGGIAQVLLGALKSRLYLGQTRPIKKMLIFIVGQPFGEHYSTLSSHSNLIKLHPRRHCQSPSPSYIYIFLCTLLC